MRFLKCGLISATVLLFVIACNQKSVLDANSANNTIITAETNTPKPRTTVSTDELAAARKIYSQQCAECHKENGAGGFSTIDGKRIKAPNFTSDRMKKDDDNDWIETIENGAAEDGMPAYKGKISDEDIKKLVKLIRHDFQGKL